MSRDVTFERNDVPLGERGRARERSSPPFHFLVSANIKLSFFIDEAEP